MLRFEGARNKDVKYRDCIIVMGINASLHCSGALCEILLAENCSDSLTISIANITHFSFQPLYLEEKPSNYGIIFIYMQISYHLIQGIRQQAIKIACT